MASSLSLNDCHVKKTNLLINRLHFFLHGTALLSLFYYRITNLTAIIAIQTRDESTLVPHLLILISELILCFIWILGQPSKWRPVTRAVYPERLPGDDKLPSIDVFVCTADPNKEPSLGVMNTVISALALDYPPHKLHVYLSDDGGSHATFRAMKQAWIFSRLWVPFCRRNQVKNRCPEAYFSREESDDEYLINGGEFLSERKHIETRYEEFKNCVAKIVAETSTCLSRDHPSLIEVISDANDGEGMPRLVYVAREKRPSHPHHFKAGALNVLLRVSSMMSNSPYILVLDCDMYCNDPASARQAMCFHLDSKLSPKLGFVQFPQKFHNISETDIYDGQLRYVWPKWEGLDGLRGPVVSGTCFYIKREALYGSQQFQEDVDLVQLRKRFGSSDEFIKSVYRNYKSNYPNDHQDITFSDNNTLQKEILQLLASCTYDNGTKWGKEVGFRYFAVVEDIFTSLNLHCEGWISVYCEPSRPCFLGASPMSLGEFLVQHTRWNVGLSQIALSRFSPLLYGPLRMPISQSMCYAEFAYSPFYFLALYILALVPQLCFVQGIPLYPRVSSPFFLVFLFVFVSAQLKHVEEVYSSGNSIRTWSNEQRIWMMKSLTCYVYAMLEAVMEKVGMRTASFLPTNKVVDEEQAKRYEIGVYDFQAPALFMVPLCTVYVVNVGCIVIGIGRILCSGKGMSEMGIQGLIALFGVVLNYPLVEGMVLRKDKGRVAASVSLVSALISCMIILSCVSLV